MTAGLDKANFVILFLFFSCVSNLFSARRLLHYLRAVCGVGRIAPEVAGIFDFFHLLHLSWRKELPSIMNRLIRCFTVSASFTHCRSNTAELRAINRVRPIILSSKATHDL